MESDWRKFFKMLFPFLFDKQLTPANLISSSDDWPPTVCLQVHVEFTDKQGGIKLEGPPEEVEEAREKLETMIAEMQSKLCFDQITVDPK